VFKYSLKKKKKTIDGRVLDWYGTVWYGTFGYVLTLQAQGDRLRADFTPCVYG
jgi:hypothetical protein